MPAATKMRARNQPRLRGKTAGPTINAKMLRSQKSQRQILDAAARVFATSGFDGASMRQIAEEAKVTQSLLHHHFQTKQRLFQTVCAKHAESVNKRRRFVTQQYLDGKIDSNFGLEHLIRTLVQPWIDAVNDPDPNWAIFSRFIIRSAFSDEEWSQEYAVKYLSHLGDLAEKAVRKALAGVFSKRRRLGVLSYFKHVFHGVSCPEANEGCDKRED